MERILRQVDPARKRHQALCAALLVGAIGLSLAPPATSGVAAIGRPADARSAAPAMIDLGTLGGASSGATAINDSGHVVGWSERDVGGRTVTRAFLWTHERGMHGLGTLGDSSSSSFAHDINDLGQVVGWSDETAGGQQHAFIWDVRTGMHPIATVPGATSSVAYGINDAGQVVGVVYPDGSSVARPFVWSSSTGMRLIPVPDTVSFAGAHDVNSSGSVVGRLSIDEGDRGFVWSEASGFRYLSDPEYVNEYFTTSSWWPNAINDQGWIVGQVNNPGWNTWAVVLWSPSGEVSTIEAPPAPPLAEPWSAWGNGINEAGRVVGSIYIEDEAITHAFAWDGGERLRDLDDFDETESYATGINDAGQAVGAANIAPRSSLHATLWNLPADVTPPVVRCTAPAPTFYLNAAGSAVTATVTDTNADHANTTVSAFADTGRVGRRHIMLVGMDDAGNTASVHCPYSVVYRTRTPFFMFPIDAGRVINEAVAGKTVPLRFRVLDAAWRPVIGLTTIAVGSRRAAPPDGAPIDPLEWYSNQQPGLAELGGGYYVFHWRTSAAFQGTTRQLRVDLGDGVIHSSWFRFTG